MMTFLLFWLMHVFSSDVVFRFVNNVFFFCRDDIRTKKNSSILGGFQAIFQGDENMCSMQDPLLVERIRFLIGRRIMETTIFQIKKNIKNSNVVMIMFQIMRRGWKFHCHSSSKPYLMKLNLKAKQIRIRIDWNISMRQTHHLEYKMITNCGILIICLKTFD